MDSCSTVGIFDQVYSPLIIYPNPTSGYLRLQLFNQIDAFRITLKSPLGVLLNSQNVQSSNQLDLIINEPPGIYYLTVETSSGLSKTFKVLKE